MRATSLLPRGYIGLQLHFAAWLSHGDARSFPLAVLQGTNFFRRFGLGHPDDAPSSLEWQRYVAELCDHPSLEAQVEWTSHFAKECRRLAVAAPRAVPDGSGTGAFSGEVVDDALRFHFVPVVGSECSPLHAGQLARLREELGMLVQRAVAQHPELRLVRGGSWLYNTESYRSLFPPDHVATARVRTGIVRFQGSSSWGQFLDHRGRVKVDLARRFIDGLRGSDPATPWRAFPMPALWVESPIDVFIDHYLGE